MDILVNYVRESIIGAHIPITTPFGEKPLVYADYTASGRALSFIENYIQEHVLPYYANTHSETSYTGARITALREQARNEIRRAINGTLEDQIIFCGSGATAAINKLIDILGLRLPLELSIKYSLELQIPADERPVVFIGPYEHHSNELPWRESIVELVAIPMTEMGQIDLMVLDAQLRAYASRPLRIGSFSAASNVTGIKSDVDAISTLLKQHGALSFWDYAAAAPYVKIDMNSRTPLDAVFISPHKFIGGPGTPGVLVVKKSIMTNSVPAVVGGGTLMYVTPEDHRFLVDSERREEGGTPAIVESIRAGLVFKLQQQVGLAEIERREQDYIQRAIIRFKACPNLKILGNDAAPRLSIMSLRFTHGDKDLHYGFVVSLLNDLFGIQVRGGCSCAGPYGHSLLGMDMAYSKAIESELELGHTIMRPGWVRLNFNYFIHEDEFQFLVRAVELVATLGWRLLPYYQFDSGAGVWRYQGLPNSLPPGLEALNFGNSYRLPTSNPATFVSLKGVCDLAERILLEESRSRQTYVLRLSGEAERLRWFVLPQEILATL